MHACLPKKEIKQEPEVVVVVEKTTAPVFAHGKGMGLAGDDVIIPHVFMTEARAREIIENELKKTNIIFDKKDMPLKKIKIEKKKISFNKEEFAKGNLVKEEIVIGKTNLIIDGYCTELDLGYEFISKEDYEDYWQKEYTATIQGHDLKIIAEYLNKKLNEGNEINAVVFYDPLPEINESRAKKKLIKYQNQRNKKKYMKALKESTDKLQKKQKEEAVALLKEQVNDFIKWTTNLGPINLGNK